MAPAALAAAALLACALGSAIALAVRARRARAGIPRQAAAVLSAVSGALGDAVLAFDAGGRLAHANAAGLALVAGRGAQGSCGDHDLLGEDVAVLLRGLARGPAAGTVELVRPSGRVRALAAAVRLGGARPLDVLVLRPTVAAPAGVAAVPPPGRATPPRPAPPEEVDDADILDDATRPMPLATGAAALAAELRAPLSRAGAAIALLRLALPRGQAGADEQLRRAEEELRVVEAALAALGEPLAAAAPRPVDLAALAAEAAAEARFAPGVRVRSVGAGVAALADAAQLKEALHRLLALAARAMPQGGELGLRVRGGREAVLEIADSGPSSDGGLELALAERLVAAQGGRVERAAVPGRGTLVRVALPGAPAGAVARPRRPSGGRA